MPAKFVSRTTRIAAPEGKTAIPLTRTLELHFPGRKVKRILAQRSAMSNFRTVDFIGNYFCGLTAVAQSVLSKTFCVRRGERERKKQGQASRSPLLDQIARESCC